MAEVIPFPFKPTPSEEPDIDLLTAVDWAIRDLRDISRRWDDASRRQAEDCRLMLERAFKTAVEE